MRIWTVRLAARATLMAVMGFASITTSQGQPDQVLLRQGATVPLRDKMIRVTRLDTLPFVDSDYSRRFQFDLFDNPKLKDLRERYGLDRVVAAGGDEFEKQILLMDWTHQQFQKFGHPSAQTRGALEILERIHQGHAFFCAQYAQVLVSCAASLGWVDRVLALRRHQGVAQGGSTEHSTTEIWSNQYGKWVMLDPTSNMYLEKAGLPLNAFEIRQEWFYGNGKDLVFVIGKERKKYKKSDLPIFLKHFADFGDLAVAPDELDKYGFIAYIPNTNLMDAGEDYQKMFIVKDALCAGTRWHERTVPAHPEVDPYFPINQAALSLTRTGDGIAVDLKTLTPNFKTYLVRVDGGAWKPSPPAFVWNVHEGGNQLETKAVNRFGVEGPCSMARLDVVKTAE